MVDDATIRIGSDVSGAIADILAVGAALQTLEAEAISASAVIASATGAIATGIAGVGIAAGAAAAGGVAMAIDAFTEYEQTVANAASVTGEVGDAYDYAQQNIEAISQELGANTVFSAQQAADAMYDLASAGYDVAAMVSGDLKPVMDLAAATQNDLTQTTEIVTATLGQFTLGIDSSDRVADVFAKTIGSSKATLDKIGLSFKYVGTIASQFGDSIEDTSAALAIMYNNGLRGEQAGRALRIAYGRLSNPTQDVIDVTGQLGLTLQDVNPQFHTMTEILQTLNDRGISVAQTMELFGVEAGTGMGAVLNNLPAMEALEQKFYDAGGAAEDMAEKQLDTLQGSLTLLFSKINILAIEIGRKFAPYVRDAADVFGEISKILLNNVDPAFAQLQQYVQDLEPTWIALKSSVLSVIGITQDLAGDNAVGWLIDQINTLSTAMALVFQFFDQHPIILQTAKTVAVASVMFLALEGAVALASAAYAGYLAMIGFVNAAMLVYNGVMVGAITWTAVLESLLALLGGSITLIIISISLLAAAWYTNFGGIRDFTDKVVNEVKDLFWDSVDALEHYINTLIVMHNDLVEKLGVGEKWQLIDFDGDVKSELESYSKAIDEYIKQPISDAFSLDTGGLSMFNMSEIDAAEEAVNSMVEDAQAIADANIAGAEAANSMAAAYNTMKSGRIAMPAGYSSSDEASVTEFGSYADVQAARAAGTLKPGTVWSVNVNVDKVNTKDTDGDSLGDAVNRAVASTGGSA